MSKWRSSSCRRLATACCLTILLPLAAFGLDRITLETDSTLFCRVRWEGRDSVVIILGREDTILPIADVKTITYSTHDFETGYKMVTFSLGYEIRRGAVEFDEQYDLLEGDTLIAGPNGPLVLAFVSGMQTAIDPNSRAVVTKVGREKNDDIFTVELRLLEGGLHAAIPETKREATRLVVHSPNAIVRTQGAAFMAGYQEDEQVTLVGVMGGIVGVRLPGSDIGEVMVNAGECVLMSGPKKKIMQDELTGEHIQSLNEASRLFARRDISEVEVPKKKGKESNLCLLSDDLTLYGRKGFWIIPQITSGYAGNGNHQKALIHPKVSIGFNTLQWLCAYAQLSYLYRQDRENIDNFSVNHITQQILAEPGVAGYFTRRRLFAVTAFSWTNRFYIRDTYNGDKVDPPDTYFSHFNIDAYGGFRFPVISFFLGGRLVAHEYGMYSRVVGGLTLHFLKDRLLLGSQGRMNFYKDDPEIQLHMNIGSCILN